LLIVNQQSGGENLRLWKLWWLLISRYSYLPIPRRWQAPLADLPQALVLLPLWGLAAGLLNAAVVRWGGGLGQGWLAALLVFFTLFSSGAMWLRDVLCVASGLKPPPLPPNLAAALETAQPLQSSQPPPQPLLPEDRPLPLNRGALLTGCLYLLLQYGCFVALLHNKVPLATYVLAAVVARFVYLWGVYDFAALQPAFLHRGFPRRAFIRATAFSLVVVLVCTWLTPALWPALLPPLLAATIFYRRRLSVLCALDEAAYGAAAAWSEIMLCLCAGVFFMCK
jgi:cobalamin synthase